MTKHFKTRRPTDADLTGNPLIGGSKGTTMAGVTPDELEIFEGVNTIEGDRENGTNAQGGIDKQIGRGHRRPREAAYEGKSAPAVKDIRELQGKKTHEQQLRMLERKPDVPDQRQIEAALSRPPQDDRAHLPRQNVRDSEFAISRGGMNQESEHNKHNRPRSSRS